MGLLHCHQQIYTSASELLNSSGSGLGVVACTRDFPEDVQRDLDKVNRYPFLADLPPDDPAKHPPRIVMSRSGKDQRALCISQVIFAGADHTARTTPLSHRFVFLLDEDGSDAPWPSDLIRVCAPLFKRKWDQPPSHLGATIEVDEPDDPSALPLPSCDRLWRGQAKCLLPAVAAALMESACSGRPVVVCINREDGFHAASVLADILDLLPRSVQLDMGCASHVIDSSDAPGEARLLVTYPTTEFVKRYRERRGQSRPHVFDLTSATALEERPSGSYQALMVELLKKPDPRVEIRDAVSLFDVLDLRCQHAELFTRIRGLEQELSSVGNHKGLVKATNQLKKVLHDLGQQKLDRAHEYLVDHMNKCIKNRVTSWSSKKEKWDSLLSLLLDGELPEESRKAALTFALKPEPDQQLLLDALTQLLGSPDKKADSLNRDIEQIISSHCSSGLRSFAVRQAAKEHRYCLTAEKLLLTELAPPPKELLGFIQKCQTPSTEIVNLALERLEEIKNGEVGEFGSVDDLFDELERFRKKLGTGEPLSAAEKLDGLIRERAKHLKQLAEKHLGQPTSTQTPPEVSVPPPEPPPPTVTPPIGEQYPQPSAARSPDPFTPPPSSPQFSLPPEPQGQADDLGIEVSPPHDLRDPPLATTNARGLRAVRRLPNWFMGLGAVIVVGVAGSWLARALVLGERIFRSGSGAIPLSVVMLSLACVPLLVVSLERVLWPDGQPNQWSRVGSVVGIFLSCAIVAVSFILPAVFPWLFLV
ncbi:hypothetical protein Pla123a_43270 [Posidoniimonas polymericola]|uniref:GTPase-associated protein 1 N-terminal domain-containing protein n=1 Tax=Posidoniimonas polymericola TaxID=2528002 RepID=A0A5C5XWM0_9BACT|nr:hypothetical protein [Posidoniimonas polymericola]TWT66899.1 hypothetical protein Pla123a_43270 [Posidoniimonas polymericola]